MAQADVSVWGGRGLGAGVSCHQGVIYSEARAGAFRAGVGVSHESGALGFVSTRSGGRLYRSQLASTPWSCAFLTASFISVV